MKHPEDEWQHGPHFDQPPHDLDPERPFADGDAPEDEPSEMVTIRRIELLSRLHHMAFRSLFCKEGLPPAQAGALRTIIRHPGLSQRELADRLHIQRATATVMLQKMEKAGVIDRRPDPEDQRISRIYPTEAALAHDAETKKAVSAYFERCFSGIAPETLDLLDQTMIQIGMNLRGILRENPDPMSKE